LVTPVAFVIDKVPPAEKVALTVSTLLNVGEKMAAVLI